MNAMRPTLLFSAFLLAACSQPSNSSATAAEPAPRNDTAMPAAKTGSAIGTVQSIDVPTGKVTIAHGPVEGLGWPAMTMGFKATPEQLASVKTGQKVKFEFQMQGGDAVLTQIATQP